MPTSVEEEIVTTWAPPEFTPLDEAAWKAWETNGRAEDLRTNAAQTAFVKSTAVAALLAEAGLWSYFTPYEVVVRLVVTLAAIILIYKALHAKEHAYTVVFAALAIMYNPVVPLFSFTGDLAHILVVISAVPFVLSLIRRSATPAGNA